jgi:hypothetical protein
MRKFERVCWLYERMQEFLLPPACRCWICWRCCSCAGEGIAEEFVDVEADPSDIECRGRDCLRLLRSAGLRLYLTLACVSSSLKTCDTLAFSLAEASTKPFSQSTVTTDSVVSKSTWNTEHFIDAVHLYTLLSTHFILYIHDHLTKNILWHVRLIPPFFVFVILLYLQSVLVL